MGNHWSFSRYRHHKRNTEPNDRVPLRAFQFGCIVSFIVRNLPPYLQKEPKLFCYFLLPFNGNFPNRLCSELGLPTFLYSQTFSILFCPQDGPLGKVGLYMVLERYIFSDKHFKLQKLWCFIWQQKRLLERCAKLSQNSKQVKFPDFEPFAD